MTARVRLTVKRKAELFRDRDGICHICTGKISVGSAWEVEHEIPLAMGGADDETNWRLAHVKCHKRKTAQDLATIAKSNRVRVKHRGIKRPRTITRWRRFNGQPVYAERER
jgi:5-methylcytosine-specific restriction protein A